MSRELLEAFHPGGVDQHQDRAQRLADRRYRGVDLRSVGDVGDMAEPVVGGAMRDR